MEEKKFEFRVGDKVEFGGVKGEVTDVTHTQLVEVRLKLDNGKHVTEAFSIDGRYNSYHTKPLLVLISRPKVKKTKNRWVHLVDGILGTYLFTSHYEAYSCANREDTIIVPLTVEWEE